MESFTESFGFEASERFCGNFGAGHSIQKNVFPLFYIFCMKIFTICRRW